ncbi:MAG: DsbE family thiol:disulfide interchange protein [Gammaproteobacteria bacterium]|nr:MAG: DsbE family thiol:disulfide interchange protein [Gammaproteobacteria bacterium]
MKGRWLVFSIPLILFLVMAYFLATGLENDPKELPSMQLNNPLPAFQLTALENPEKILTEKNLKGPALINVWATWCPSCRIEHPVLNRLAQAGITIYGIDHTDERAAAIEYLKQQGNPYSLVVFDHDGELGLDMGITGAPETFLIDAQGIVRYHHVGIVNEQSWREILWPNWLDMGGSDPTEKQGK